MAKPRDSVRPCIFNLRTFRQPWSWDQYHRQPRCRRVVLHWRGRKGAAGLTYISSNDCPRRGGVGWNENIFLLDGDESGGGVVSASWQVSTALEESTFAAFRTRWFRDGRGEIRPRSRARMILIIFEWIDRSKRFYAYKNVFGMRFDILTRFV